MGRILILEIIAVAVNPLPACTEPSKGTVMSSMEEEPFSAWAFPPAGLQYSAVFLQQIPSSLGDNPSLLFFSLGIDKCPSPFLLLPMPLRISYRQSGEALRKHHTRCHPNCQIFKALSYHISSFVAKNGKIYFPFPVYFY